MVNTFYPRADGALDTEKSSSNYSGLIGKFKAFTRRENRARVCAACHRRSRTVGMFPQEKDFCERCWKKTW